MSRSQRPGRRLSRPTRGDALIGTLGTCCSRDGFRFCLVLLTAMSGILGACGESLSTGLADRCAALAKAAMPSADLDIPNRTAQADSLTKVIARVEGTRTNLPETLPREVAAECEFNGDTLTAFRWVKGGPAQ